MARILFKRDYLLEIMMIWFTSSKARLGGIVRGDVDDGEQLILNRSWYRKEKSLSTPGFQLVVCVKQPLHVAASCVINGCDWQIPRSLFWVLAFLVVEEYYKAWNVGFLNWDVIPCHGNFPSSLSILDSHSIHDLHLEVSSPNPIIYCWGRDTNATPVVCTLCGHWGLFLSLVSPDFFSSLST